VKILVTLSAGSQVDILARLVGRHLADAFGQQFIVEDRPRAGGTMATSLVARANPDGYTLLMAANGHAINPSLYPDLPYDTAKDFAGISLVARVPSVLVVPSSLEIRSVAELIALAKARPGQLNFASPGIGSAGHLAAEQLKTAAHIDIVHVPYKGTPEALADTIANRTQMFFAPLGAALPLLSGGHLTALAVTSASRSPIAPAIPTLAESGVPGYRFDFWYGLLGPHGTPATIIDRLGAEIGRMLDTPAVAGELAAQGATPLPMAGGQFDEFIAEEMKKYRELVAVSGAKAR
jgi:tripartite-type tricarboxylate transporter receptor subunit TctC